MVAAVLNLIYVCTVELCVVCMHWQCVKLHVSRWMRV